MTSRKKKSDKPDFMIDVVEFFDVYNQEHIIAYQHLQETGKWPIDFAIELSGHPHPSMWQVGIINKMADAWVKYMSKLEL